MGVEDIGARLVIEDGGAIAEIQALTDEVDKLQKALLRLGTTADASMKKVTASGAEADAAAGTAAASSKKAGVAAEDAGAAGVMAAQAHGQAIDETTVKTEKLRKSTQSLKSDIESVGSGPVGKAGIGGIAVGLGVVGESIDQYVKFNKQMTQLFTQAGIAKSRIPALSAGALKIGEQTGVNFSDVANQLYRIASASSGLKETNRQILSLGKSAADIAVLFNVSPGAPTEQVARLFGSVFNAAKSNKLQQTGGSPAGLAALLNAAVGTGDIRGQDLIGALGRGVLQSGEAVGAKLPDILSWIDLSTRLGAQPSTSGTLIAHSLQQIATPSEQGQKAEEMFGINPGDLRTIMQKQGIGQAVSYLTNSLKNYNPLPYYPVTGKNAAGAASANQQLTDWGLSPALIASMQNHTLTQSQQGQIEQFMLTKIFGGARQEIPVLSIAENPTLYSDIERQIRAQANLSTYNKDLKGALGTPAQQLQIGMRQLQGYSIQLGKDLTPALVKFVHGVVDAAKYLSDHRALLDGILISAGSLAALGASFFILSKIIKLFTGIGKAGSAIGRLLGFGGGSGKNVPVTANTDAIEENTGAILRLTETMGISGAEGLGGKGAGALSPYGTLEGDAAAGATGAGETGLLARVGGLGVGSKLLLGGTATLIASQLYNAFLEKPLAHLIGGKTGTAAASGLGGVLTGAGIGATIGSVIPVVGTVAGGVAGGAIGGLVELLKHHHGPNPSTTVENLWAKQSWPGHPDEHPVAIGRHIKWVKNAAPTTHDQTVANLTSTLALDKGMTSLDAAKTLTASNLAKYGAGSTAYKTSLQREQLLINQLSPHGAGGAFGNTKHIDNLEYRLNNVGAYGETGRAGYYGLKQRESSAFIKYASALKWSGGMGNVKATLSNERASLKALQNTPGNNGAQIKDLKSEIAKGTAAQKALQADSKSFMKAKDAVKQTQDLINAMKTNATTGNDLLKDINTTMKTLPSTLSEALGNVHIQATVSGNSLATSVQTSNKANAARS